MTTELTCPSCGTLSYFEEVTREATAFCRICDYPLFWARAAHVQAGENGSSTEGLRRLPGTAGRVAIATFACPVCAEPNTLTANICIRCGADLHPAPVVEAPPPPPLPEPEPEPEPVKKTRWWPWILLGVLAVIAIVLILVLTLH